MFQGKNKRSYFTRKSIHPSKKKKKKKDISNLVAYFAILFSRLDSLTEMHQP